MGAFYTMKTKDLIKQLQDMVDEHETSGALEVMGEHEIMIDTWQSSDIHTNTPCTWQYRGFSPNVVVDTSGDGVYRILVAKESWS